MPFRNLPGAKLCHFRKGEVLISAGQIVTHIYYLVIGTVYREIATESGSETIINVKTTTSPLEALVGVMILYRKDYLSSGSFIAKTNCTCYQIPKNSYLAMANKDPKVLLETISVLMEEHTHLTELYNTKREGNVASRLCGLLLSKAQLSGDMLIVPSEWTNIELAKFLGVHQVTIARIIRVLKEREVVCRTKLGLSILNREKLTNYADQTEHIQYRYPQ